MPEHTRVTNSVSFKEVAGDHKVEGVFWRLPIMILCESRIGVVFLVK